MKLAKILKIALNMVKANKLRSWLTIIGVIIGIASVMVIITTGEYFQEQVTETLEGLGGDTITIVASVPFEISSEEDVEYEEDTVEISDESVTITSATTAETEEESNSTLDPIEFEAETEAQLTRKDVFVLRSIPDVEYVNVNVQTGAELKFGSESTFVWINGVDPGVWPDITKKKVGEGRMLAPGDRAVVVISNELAKGTFEQEIRLNQMIPLNGKSYRVVGILAKDGGLLGGMGDIFGSSVYMPYQEVYPLRNSEEDISEREKDVYDTIELKLYNEADYDAALQEIERKLRLSRRVTEDTQDFYVSSSKETIESTQKLINGLTTFLAFIAGISLLVGSTGIANTMFTSVLEKTKEIGIMKAIGAKNSDIMMIFLCNAAMISLVGGIIGILLGTAAVQLFLFLISVKLNVPFEFALSLKGTLIATLVSIVVGLIAGLVPAKNASELKPVDALRYE
ncbi:MAG: putative transport system permease protein [Euryarchaeota archaeon]|nr:putative transport system permease protein [Euryarchaeota archaeon]